MSNPNDDASATLVGMQPVDFDEVEQNADARASRQVQAVTRPRKKLIIVGSRHVLRAQSADPDLQATIDLLADLLESCTYFADHHDGTAQLWESEY